MDRDILVAIINKLNDLVEKIDHLKKEILSQKLELHNGLRACQKAFTQSKQVCNVLAENISDFNSYRTV